MSAGVHEGQAAIPTRVAALAGGDAVRPVWANELGGLTFELRSESGRRFVKWAPVGSELDFTREATRLSWAIRYTRVPRVLEQGSNAEGSWLVTAGLPGDNAVADRWKAEPAKAVRALGEGLRALHDALPVGECPFTWSAADRAEKARRAIASGRSNPTIWQAVHRSLDVSEALARLAHPPEPDQLVVCQGDACAPNTLLDDEGRVTGYVDLGALGIADRWADLAVATWSTQWNYGPDWEAPLLAAYGIAPDPERTCYYRLLWDLCP